MWFWRQKGHFEVLDCENRLDRILVASGLSPSVAEATRLIKQGSVRARRNYDEDWAAIKNPRACLSEGWPWEVRVGRSALRMLPREGRDGWDCYPTHAELMFPLEHQGLRSWRALMLWGRVPFWPYWQDQWEKFWARCGWIS
jgi:S4 domain